MTHTTVFLAVLMLLIFGGGAINDFALLFTIGTVTGCFSSVYIATPIMLFLRRVLKKTEMGAPAH